MKLLMRERKQARSHDITAIAKAILNLDELWSVSDTFQALADWADSEKTNSL